MTKKFPVKNHRNPRLPLIVALVFIAVLTVITAGFRVVRYAIGHIADGFFYPYNKLARQSDKLSDNSLLLLDKDVLASRVEKLTAVNRELALQSQSANALLEENRKLRSLLNLRGNAKISYTTAGILLRDPQHFSDGFTIDKGRRDGIREGAAVVDVNDNGRLLLVGIVTQVDSRTGKVMTVLNKALRISGRVSSNKAVGFTNTGEVVPGRGRAAFGMLPVRDDYIPGSMVTTTGFELGVPAGIKIGELHTGSSRNSSEQADFNCELVPAVNFESLRFVAVAMMPVQPEEVR